MMNVVKVMFAASLVLFLLSRAHRYAYPDAYQMSPLMFREPAQTETLKKPFTLNGRYEIRPMFDYDLYGMVVSYHHSADDLTCITHAGVGDYLNNTDLCVIWGSNILSGIYQKMNFSNGPWMCCPDFKNKRSVADYKVYKNEKLSNNHLLAADPSIEKTLMEIRPGDQVHLKGQLVSYAIKGTESWRTSSTVRDDYGCEVIYVTVAEILKKGHPVWRLIYELSKLVLIVTGTVLLARALRLKEALAEWIEARRAGR